MTKTMTIKISSADTLVLDEATAEILKTLHTTNNADTRVEIGSVVNENGVRVLSRKIFIENPSQKTVTVLQKIDLSHDVKIQVR